jgi:glycerol-3-phosphate dehydrogenase
MIRAGLFLYDHLARRASLPGSHAVSLDSHSGLSPHLRHGFEYSDCRVDDARLVVANAMSARELGAMVLTRTRVKSARRDAGLWRVELENQAPLTARAIVNAAGPWVKEVLQERLSQSSKDNVRLVKGSHIVVRRLYEGDHAFILQNDDRRVVFMIPYGDEHTLVGTTDVTEPAPDHPAASEAEISYLCRAVNRYLARPVSPADVVWSYAGIRPLHDDGSADPSEVTRDYALRVYDVGGAAPVLSVFGGKITTFRRLAEEAVDRLAPYFPHMSAAWTEKRPLSGSDFGGATREQARDAFFARHSRIPQAVLRPIFRRHGAHADAVVGDGDLGEHFGAGLSEREVRYFRDQEWAQSAEDVLWRRSKAGLLMSQSQRARVAEAVGR